MIPSKHNKEKKEAERGKLFFYKLSIHNSDLSFCRSEEAKSNGHELR